MAKNSEYTEKTKPILNFLYVVVVLGLLVALFMMVQKDRERRKQYDALVSAAASTEQSVDISTRKNEEDLVPDDAGELTPQEKEGSSEAKDQSK